jgi:hypothetical protein
LDFFFGFDVSPRVEFCQVRPAHLVIVWISGGSCMQERPDDRVRTRSLQFNPICQHPSVESNYVSDPDGGNLPLSCPTLHCIFPYPQQRGKLRNGQRFGFFPQCFDD